MLEYIAILKGQKIRVIRNRIGRLETIVNNREFNDVIRIKARTIKQAKQVAPILFQQRQRSAVTISKNIDVAA